MIVHRISSNRNHLVTMYTRTMQESLLCTKCTKTQNAILWMRPHPYRRIAIHLFVSMQHLESHSRQTIHIAVSIHLFPVSLYLQNQTGKRFLLTQSKTTAFAPCLRLCLIARNINPCRIVTLSPTNGEITGDETPPTRTG